MEWVEFIDESHFIKPFQGPPWRNQPGVTMLPTEWVALVAQPGRIHQIRHTERAALIAEDVQSRGIRYALVIVTDEQGKIALQDGHHRLLAAQEQGISKLPVQFQRSEMIKVSCGSFPDLIEPLLKLMVA